MVITYREKTASVRRTTNDTGQQVKDTKALGKHWLRNSAKRLRELRDMGCSCRLNLYTTKKYRPARVLVNCERATGLIKTQDSAKK